MNKKVVIGGIVLGSIVALLAGSKANAAENKGAAPPSFGDAVQAMKDGSADRLLTIAQSKDFDAGTQACLHDQAVRMKARSGRAKVAPTPLLVTTGVDLDNNEFSAKVFALEGDPKQLRGWANAYRNVYPSIAQALDAKIAAIGSLDKPAPVESAPALGSPATPPPAIVTPVPHPVTAPPQALPPAAAAPPSPATRAAIPLPDLTPPGPGPDPGRARVLNLVANLNAHARPYEDKSMVQMVQSAEGMKPDGFYGTSVALVIAKKYGIVPPLPRYFSKDKQKTAAAKRQYKEEILKIAASDPAREAEWLRASKVDNQ